MERSEPSLAPEWLKNAGSSVGGNNSSHSDDHVASRVAGNNGRNNSFMNSNGHDFGRSFSSERTASSNFRRSSSSYSSGNFRSHSSIGRNHHDRDWDKDHYDSRDLDKSVFGDRPHRDLSEPLRNNSLSKFNRDGLKRSQSMISGKHGDSWPNRAVTESSNLIGNNANGFLTKGSPIGGVNKKSFEKDFPSLGAEERAVTPEVGRVPSPGLSTAIQSLPTGSSSSLGNEKWTSALAEVPSLVGSNGTVLPSVQQTAPSTSMPVTLSSTTSLNMAEAVAQGPNRAQTATQVSVGTQRLEELAIKQSRQLIPVKPSLPKTLVSNSSDKQKSKVGQQHMVSSLPAHYTHRGGPIKTDVSKGSNGGKLHVLKPVREKNGATPVAKDNVSPNGSKAASSTPAASPSVVPGSAAGRGQLTSVVPDRKPSVTVLDKRPTTQAQSRNDFFNLVRKKSMVNSSSVANSAPVQDASTAPSPSYLEKNHAEKETVSAANTPEALDEPLQSNPGTNHSPVEKSDSTCNGDIKKRTSNGKRHHPIFSEEEEAAFLRSMGWEENGDNEDGLTEEEINSFYKNLDAKFRTSKPSSLSSTLIRFQQNFLLPFDSQI